jgi:putative transcriptional regulator
MSKLGKRLIAAAKESRAIARGEADPASYRIHVPAEIDVRRLRRKLGLSQNEFAQRYGFTPARIRDWEQGRSHPDGAVRAYLLVIQRDPNAVERALRVA